MHAVDPQNARRAITNALHDARAVVDLDEVVDPDGAFHQQYPAADEVVDNVLCAETDTDRDRAGNKRKRCQRHVEKRERRHDDDNQQRVENNALQQVGGVGPEFRLGQALLGEPFDEFADDVAGDQDEHDQHQLADDDSVAGDTEQLEVPDCLNRIH